MTHTHLFRCLDYNDKTRYRNKLCSVVSRAAGAKAVYIWLHLHGCFFHTIDTKCRNVVTLENADLFFHISHLHHSEMWCVLYVSDGDFQVPVGYQPLLPFGTALKVSVFADVGHATPRCLHGVYCCLVQDTGHLQSGRWWSMKGWIHVFTQRVVREPLCWNMWDILHTFN